MQEIFPQYFPPSGKAPRRETIAAIGQPTFAHQGASRPNKHHYQGLIGATRLPVALYVPTLSPNDHPTTTKRSLGVVQGHPTHAGLNTSPVGPRAGLILESHR